MATKQQTIVIQTRDEADAALREIANLERQATYLQTRLNEKIAALKLKFVEDCGTLQKTLKRWLKALEKWATKNKEKEFPEESKTLELNFGKIYFKWTPYRIEFDVEENTVIERLRARKMDSCIRVVTEVNKEALENSPDEVLKAVGARRERDDKFHHEVKSEEVK